MTLKEQRDALWAELDDLLAEYKPRENAIRASIREIQKQLAEREMRPVVLKLQAKVDDGEATEADVLKLEMWKAALDG